MADFHLVFHNLKLSTILYLCSGVLFAEYVDLLPSLCYAPNVLSPA